MKANELMIGDWVTSKKWIEKPFKITRINDSGKYYYGITAEGSQVGPFLIEELEPIPLTAEILEKNGFTRFGTDYILKDRHFGLKNPSTPDNYLDNYWLRVSIKAVHIESVHELQNAMRLCGIEKEIEL